MQDVVVNSETAIKYYLSISYYDEIRKIEENFQTIIRPNNPEVGNWINNHMANQTIDQMSKVILLLKLHFAHWLSIESVENDQRWLKSTTGRWNVLGHGGLKI